MEVKTFEAYSMRDAIRLVKTEFGKFGTVLDKAQKKINEANNELDKLVTTRTNVINRQLREVQELPESTTELIIDDDQGVEDLNLIE